MIMFLYHTNHLIVGQTIILINQVTPYKKEIEGISVC